MSVKPEYPIWKLHAECPVCRGMIHRTDDRSDLPGVLQAHGLEQEEEEINPHEIGATAGICPPVTVAQEWRCPGCGKRWDELAWEYK